MQYTNCIKGICYAKEFYYHLRSDTQTGRHYSTQDHL